jgi:hypothetical protein
MKYLKLFEAFDSVKLSRTLGFIKPEYKNVFLSDLDKICNFIDYPLSKLSDEDLYYLPYKKAYDLSSDIDKSIIKFWFNKDGDYINKTIVSNSAPNLDKLPSNDISDYKIVSDELSLSYIRNLEEGTLVYMSCSSGSGPGYLHHSRGESYVIQNFADGYYHSGFNYHNIARYSWVISGGDFRSIKEIEFKFDKKYKEFYNLGFSFRDSSIQLKSGEPNLEKAHFSIVLDVNNLKEISLKGIKSERKERKIGAFKTNDEVKSENIKRYLDEILKSEKIISNPKIIFNKLLFSKDFLFLFRKNNFKSRINDLNRFYYDIMRSDNEDYINEMAENIKNYIIDYINVSNYLKKDIIKNKTDLKESLKSGDFLGYPGARHGSEVYLEMIEKLESLSEVIYNKFKSLEMNNLYDLESFVSKFDILINYMNNNRNYFSKIYDYGIYYFNDRDSMKTVIFENNYNRDVLDFNKTGYYRLVELIKRL